MIASSVLKERNSWHAVKESCEQVNPPGLKKGMVKKLTGCYRKRAQ